MPLHCISNSTPGRFSFLKVYLAWICLIASYATSFGNQVQLSDLRLDDERHLSVGISWEHAWNLIDGPENHDAIWIFAKIKPENGIWQPLRLSNQSTEFSAEGSTPLAITSTQDGFGVFAKFSQTGALDIAGSRITLTLNQPLADGAYEINVFGIEMVWIPEGPFWLGDGSSNESLAAGDGSGSLFIQGSAALPIGTGMDTLGINPSFGNVTQLSGDWPKGFAGFYAMKYEISQNQYSDFLNHLSYTQQIARTASGPDGMAGTHALSTIGPFRNGIRIFTPSPGNQPATFGHDTAGDGTFNGGDDAQDRACNFLNWGDLTAYLDWAGLSPMTEMEYEKACRGPLPALAGEFAWGTDAILDANTPLLDGTSNEGVVEIPTAPTGLGSHGYDGPKGPLRSGFAALQNSNRLTAGASYYGLMEMSGNLWELCVSISEGGTSFTGSPGDGRLSDDGNANQADWPAASGAGYRGGGWNSGILPGFRDLAISDRYYIDLAPDLRRNTAGGRGVRR